MRRQVEDSSKNTASPSELTLALNQPPPLRNKQRLLSQNLPLLSPSLLQLSQNLPQQGSQNLLMRQIG